MIKNLSDVAKIRDLFILQKCGTPSRKGGKKNGLYINKERRTLSHPDAGTPLKLPHGLSICLFLFLEPWHKGAFNNYVDRILPFLDHEFGQKHTFFDPLTRHLVNVVIEWPLTNFNSHVIRPSLWMITGRWSIKHFLL